MSDQVSRVLLRQRRLRKGLPQNAYRHHICRTQPVSFISFHHVELSRRQCIVAEVCRVTGIINSLPVCTYGELGQNDEFFLQCLQEICDTTSKYPGERSFRFKVIVRSSNTHQTDCSTCVTRVVVGKITAVFVDV